MKKTKYTSIELLRILAAISVVFFHFGSFYLENGHIFPLSFIFVEFFFIVSGFFMMKHLTEKDQPLDTVTYILNKVKGFFPILAVTFFVQLIVFTLSNELQTVGAVFGALFHFKWEFLLLHGAGFIQDPTFGVDYLQGQTWYLSAMILALVVAYPLAKHFRRVYIQVISPLACVMIYSYLIQSLGTLNVGNEYCGFLLNASLRGFAGTCAGSVAYCLRNWALEKKTCSRFKTTFSILELGAYLLVAALFVFGRDFAEEDSLFYVLVFGLLVVLATLNQTPIARFFNTHGTKMLTFLGKYSLYLYLCHWNVVMGMRCFIPDMKWVPAFAIYIPVVCLYALGLKALDERRKSAKPILVICLILLAVALMIPVLV